MTDIRRMIMPLLVAAVLAFAVATLGGLLTDIGPWYAALRKPSWQPPNWLFGPVWSFIFALIAWSAALAWVKAPTASLRLWVVVLFALNAAFNVGWSFLFFYMKRPLWALIEIVPLWGSILLLIVFLQRISATASRMLWPYIAWVSFAGFLNFTVVQLN